jgi:hypothetical protein
MTITEAITTLEMLARRHRGDVDVFFDCPQCGKSTAPDSIVVVVEKPKAVLRVRDT